MKIRLSANRKGMVRLFLFLLVTGHWSPFTAVAQDSLKESLSELNRIPPLKKTANLPWGRDPFVPLVGEGFAGPANLRLTAIIYREKMPSAIINGQIVYTGDSIEGQKIIAITKQYVILRGMGVSYKLEMGNPVGQTYEIKKSQ